MRGNTPGGNAHLPPGLRRKSRDHVLTHFFHYRHELAARFDETGVQPAAFAIE